MDRGKNQCAARAVPPIAGSSRASALHLLRLLLPRVLLDHAQEAFLKHALDYFGVKPVRSESTSSIGGAKLRNCRVLIVISLLVANSAFSGFDLFRSRSATFSRNEMKSLT